jgi:hypothetical protein
VVKSALVSLYTFPSFFLFLSVFCIRQKKLKKKTENSLLKGSRQLYRILSIGVTTQEVQPVFGSGTESPGQLPGSSPDGMGTTTLKAQPWPRAA